MTSAPLTIERGQVVPYVAHLSLQSCTTKSKQFNTWGRFSKGIHLLVCFPEPFSYACTSHFQTWIKANQIFKDKNPSISIHYVAVMGRVKAYEWALENKAEPRQMFPDPKCRFLHLLTTDQSSWYPRCCIVLIGSKQGPLILHFSIEPTSSKMTDRTSPKGVLAILLQSKSIVEMRALGNSKGILKKDKPNPRSNSLCENLKFLVKFTAWGIHQLFIRRCLRSTGRNVPRTWIATRGVAETAKQSPKKEEKEIEVLTRTCAYTTEEWEKGRSCFWLEGRKREVYENGICIKKEVDRGKLGWCDISSEMMRPPSVETYQVLTRRSAYTAEEWEKGRSCFWLEGRKREVFLHGTRLRVEIYQNKHWRIG